MRWTVCVDGGPTRVNHAACLIGEKILSFGGYCSGEVRNRNAPIDVHVLDTKTFRWARVFGEEAELNTLSKSLCEESSFEADLDWEMESSAEHISEYDWHFNDLSHDGAIAFDEDSDFKNVPYMRYGHTVVAYQGKAYLWGGRNDEFGASQKLYEYDPEENVWTAVSVETASPPARDGHSAVLFGHEMIIFGGFEEENQRFSQECYSFDFLKREWNEFKTTGTPPQYRDFHAACVMDNKMYVFGGRCDERGQFHSSADFYDDVLRYLDLKTREWKAPLIKGEVRPEGRRSNTMWTHNHKIYMFGGYDSKSEKHFDDLFCFDPKEETWLKVVPSGLMRPSARRRQCSVMVDDKLFLFGGTMPHPTKRNSNALIDLGDLFVLDYGMSYDCCVYVTTAVSIPFAYVGSLYMFDHHLLHSDHPFTVKRRFLGVGLSTSLSCVATYHILSKSYPDPFKCMGLCWNEKSSYNCVKALLLSSLVYLGTFVMDFMDDRWHSYYSWRSWKRSLTDLCWWRNTVIAPCTEELAFRACSLVLLRHCFQDKATFYCAPLLFSVSHYHHLLNDLQHGCCWTEAWLKRTVQASYTYLFGVYVSHMFIACGSVYPCIISHALCNSMGLPRVGDVSEQSLSLRPLLYGIHLTGLILFVYFLPKLSH